MLEQITTGQPEADLHLRLNEYLIEPLARASHLLGTGPIWSKIQDLTKATELPTFDMKQRKLDALLDRKLKNYRC